MQNIKEYVYTHIENKYHLRIMYLNDEIWKEIAHTYTREIDKQGSKCELLNNEKLT